MLRREWILAGLLLGSMPTAWGQGITAVTRRTFMGGVVGGAFGGGGGGGVPVSPQATAAAAALQPAAPRPPVAVGSVPTGTVGGVRVATGRPPESPEARAAREAAAAAAVLAFQQEQARKGLPSAQLALGRRHLVGDGVPRNPAVARAWLEAAAHNGVAEAREWLARIPSEAAPAPAPASPVAAP